MKLSELVTKEKSYSLSRDVETEKETETRYIHYGDIHTGIADKITNKNQLPFIKEDSYEPLLKGDLILADASEDYQGIATPAIILETTKYRIVAGLHTIVLRPSDKCDSLYLYYLLKTKSFKRHGYRMGTGMKVFGITANNVLAFKTLLPSKKEQNKISQLLKIMDRLLTLQQRKLELLKKIKQGYLQQLFPSKGQSIPNIRFLEFKENWIQKKLGNYLSIPEKKQVDNLKDLKLMTLKLNLGGINLSANRETLELGATKYFVRKSGQLIYGKQNFFHGSIAIIPDNADGYATSGDVPALDIEGIQPKFLLDYISRPSYYLEKEARAIGTGSKRIHEKDLFSFEISSPSQIEQIKITNIVDNMDKILILQKSKIQKLKQLKQAYLQKLFP
ncbi:hypothetical protein A4W78_05580 [Latilactobacillus curvatus]|nr:hypothetical protein A4W78_05580 [Latilactobacillus curvatus]